MTRRNWHILTEGDALVLARRVPVRMDFAATADFPACNRLLLAQQIRQDIWRRLQRLKGYAPVVRIHRDGDRLQVTAGGQVDGAIPSDLSDQVAEILNTPALRQRWIAHAARTREGQHHV
jgi:hypothetical protein